MRDAGAFPMIDARPLSIPARSKPRRLGWWYGDRTVARRRGRAHRSVRASGVAVALFSVLVLATIVCGWLFRHDTPLTPKTGVGYLLGICGGTTMGLLALYPARKHLRFMRTWGLLPHWFRIHMMLGVLGPILILFHCNFRLGAPNSNVALISMLVVAASGVVGRYIYTRVSHGLYGARATLEELHAQLDIREHTLAEHLPPASRASQRLAAFAARARGPHRIVGARLFRLAALPLQAIWVRHCTLRDLRVDLDREAMQRGSDARTHHASDAEMRREMRRLIGQYLAALVKEVQFGAYARLFSLWHALHVPLFIMLILTGILHVVAVHMY